jgi:hypothetical protein
VLNQRKFDDMEWKYCSFRGVGTWQTFSHEA